MGVAAGVSRILSIAGIPSLLACAIWTASETGACAKGTLYSDFRSQTDALLLSNQFDKLDAMEAAFKRSDARLAGGVPSLEVFYSALASLEDERDGVHADGQPLERKKAALERWITAKPDSLAAHVALAQFWINYAWNARGNGYAAGVTEQGSRLYVERLIKAGSYLKGLPPKDDPAIYGELDEIAVVSNSPREVLASIYAAAVHDYPGYLPYYGMRANLLQEKWFGAPGELAAFEKSLLTTPGGTLGQIAIAAVATDLYCECRRMEALQDLGLDWPILKRAYEVKQRVYGLSEEDWNAALMLSSLAHDDAFAENAAAQIREFADQGYMLDQVHLAYAYLWGHGVQQSPLVAVSWYRKAAAQGSRAAEYQLGWIYEHVQPEGYPQGFTEAMKWYRLAAAHGDAVAKNNIGFMYEHGEGVDQDFAKAAAFYQEAAGQRNGRAAFHLGVLYYDGRGVARDPKMALQWIELAQGLGDAEARKWLANHEAEFDEMKDTAPDDRLQP
jgi:hypothetical protein